MQHEYTLKVPDDRPDSIGKYRWSLSDTDLKNLDSLLSGLYHEGLRVRASNDSDRDTRDAMMAVYVLERYVRKMYRQRQGAARKFAKATGVTQPQAAGLRYFAGEKGGRFAELATRLSLRRKGLLDAEENLTDAGREALARVAGWEAQQS